jgi:hypothetical protein
MSLIHSTSFSSKKVVMSGNKAATSKCSSSSSSTNYPKIRIADKQENTVKNSIETVKKPSKPAKPAKATSDNKSRHDFPTQSLANIISQMNFTSPSNIMEPHPL